MRDLYRIIQERLGCDKSCKWCVEEALGKGPCCAHIEPLTFDESGKCLTRKEKQA